MDVEEKQKQGVINLVYLIHFNEKYKHAQHYIGYARNLASRIERHRSGHGARLIAVIQAEGIRWNVVRTREGGRELERRLKALKKAATLCPICRKIQT